MAQSSSSRTPTSGPARRPRRTSPSSNWSDSYALLLSLQTAMYLTVARFLASPELVGMISPQYAKNLGRVKIALEKLLTPEAPRRSSTGPSATTTRATKTSSRPKRQSSKASAASR